MKILSARSVFYLAICLSSAFSTRCAGPASVHVAATVRLDRALAAEVSQPTIALTVIDQDPNLIWCLIKLDPAYTGMDGLVEKFMLAADSSAVAYATLDIGGQTELGNLRGGTYWVVTRGLVTAGGERLLWSLPMVVDSLKTKEKNLIFHRSNAALVLEHGNSPL